jgi:L-fuculose-phosphate aldolase
MLIIDEHRPLAEELSRYSRLCYDRNLVGAAGGNLSVRVTGKDLFLVTASGVSLRDVRPENIVIVDLNGKVIEGPQGLKPSKEINFHLAIFRARPTAQAVIHVHPTYGITFACQQRTIPLATVSARLKLKQGTIVPLANPGSMELAQNVAHAVQSSPDDATVFLMDLHGVVVWGTSLENAFNDTELSEDTARIAFLQAAATPALHNATIVDLSATLDSKTHCYPTDPPYRQSWHARMNNDICNVSKVEMGVHSATHVDAPLHFLADGADITATDLTRFAGPAIAIDCPKNPGQNITPEDFASADIRPGDIVLFRTGWEDRSCTPRFFDGEWPGLSPQAVDALIAKNVRAIGGDIASADSPSAIAAGAPAHKKAFEAGLVIFEALINLRQLAGKRFYFMGLPLKMAGAEASPVRAVAML